MVRTPDPAATAPFHPPTPPHPPIHIHTLSLTTTPAPAPPAASPTGAVVVALQQWHEPTSGPNLPVGTVEQLRVALVPRQHVALVLEQRLWAAGSTGCGALSAAACSVVRRRQQPAACLARRPGDRLHMSDGMGGASSQQRAQRSGLAAVST